MVDTTINLDDTYKKLDFALINELYVYDENGNRHKFGDLYKDYLTIFVFVRSFLCFTSKEYVEDLAKIPYSKLKERQIRLCVIGCANWKHIKAFKRLTQYPFLMFCDVDGYLYKSLGMLKSKEYGNLKQSPHVKSSATFGLMKSVFRAFKSSQAFDYQGDWAQQGGSLIIGPGQQQFHFMHVDKNACDHEPINNLLNTIGIEPVNFMAKNVLKI